MTKPRIIILMHYLELGGAEMALLGLLYALDPRKVDIDLFIHSHQGPLMKHIPSYVNLLPEIKAYSVIERPMKEALAKSPMIAVGRLLAKFQHRSYLKRQNPQVITNDASAFQYAANSIERFLPRINYDIEYDLCISFLAPHSFGISKVRAKKRLAWIHTDYSTIHVNASQELPIWDAYDNIASISKDVTASFLKTFPTLASKIIHIENILPKEYILARATEFDAHSEMPTQGVKLLSIGRFCTAKNYDNVPDIARRMVENGLSKFCWYIIGYGGDEALIRRRIEEAGMQDYVKILGKRDNPYPYIKACDIYVQPSRYEGKSITVREAQVLGKPVAITAYTSAPSQINHGTDGVIIPLDNAGCAAALVDFIQSETQQETIKKNLTQQDFAGVSEVEKIYKLMR